MRGPDDSTSLVFIEYSKVTITELAFTVSDDVVVPEPNPAVRLRDGRMCVIRPAAPGDGHAVEDLVMMANPRADRGEVRGLARSVDAETYPDMVAGTLANTKSGKTVPLRMLTSMRVADIDGKVAGVVYAAPPMKWIPRLNGQLPMRHLARLSERFGELELIAVFPQYRAQGIASLLMEDTEHRFRAFGYTAMMTTIQTEVGGDPRVEWYHKRGFTFGEWNEMWIIQFWGSRSVAATYDYMQPGQRVGFKPLTDAVTCTQPTVGARAFSTAWGGLPTCTGMLD